MEVVLLWLDDLDDVLFTVALNWERLRRVVLEVGLVASFGVAAADATAFAAAWAPALAYVASASVGAWFAGAILRACYRPLPGRASTAP
jgi:hypothetical protein